jgi:microcystin-dependent protein
MDPFIGQVVIFAGNFAPRGWALCEGQLLAISSNSALFSILGTTYGGDGRTSFGLPDLRGRVAVSPGTGPGLRSWRLGERQGAGTTTLNVTNLPQHTHAASVNHGGEDGLTATAGGNLFASDARGGVTPPTIYTNSAKAGSLSPSAITVGHTGGGLAFNNIQPTLAVNYIIATTGVYPSRN